MTTLAEHIIVAGAENRPPMLEKSMYDSWASRICIFIKGKKNGRMMLDSIDNGPLLQDDCDVQATNITFHGLPPDVYALVNHQEAAKDIWDRVKLLMKGTKLSYQERECRFYNLFDKFAYVQGETLHEYYWRFYQLINDMHTIGMIMQQVQVNTKYLDPLALVASSQTLYNPFQSPQHSGDDLIDCINKAMAFLSTVASRFPPSNNQLRTSSNPRNQATIQDGRVRVQQVQGRQNQTGQAKIVKCYNYPGEGHMVKQCTQPKRPRSSAWFKEKLMLAEAQEAGQILVEEQLTEDLDAYDLDCDDISSAKAVLMANLSSCDSDVLSEVPYSDTYLNDMINQEGQEMPYSKQTHIVDFPDNEINTQRIKPTLYDDSVIAKEHVMISVIDDEETLILEEESRSKMLAKQNDSISIEKKINISLIDYSKLNKVKEDISKRFVTQKELSIEQAFWLKYSNYNPDTSIKSHTPVRIEAPSELHKVLKKRTTSNAIMAVQTVFNQMEAAVDQCSVDKNTFEIQIKQLRIDNDQLLKQIMSQEIVHIAVNSVDILDVKKSCVNECNKCLELETELHKKKDLIEKYVYDKLLKTQSQEKDTVIRKLKGGIKSLSEKDNVENVKKDIDEIETINIELEHSVAKLLSENENLRKERELLKSIFKDQFDSIRKTRVFAIAALKNQLRKLKGKNVVDTAVSKPSATIAPGINIPKQTDSLRTKDSNKPLLTSTGLNTTTSASGSKLPRPILISNGSRDHQVGIRRIK
ncbi:hypothetical protein Tco_0965686 [Tanacetum coccineum]